ncbi:MAG: hypothetical protein R3F59_22265 [Myxococcota bacterium]
MPPLRLLALAALAGCTTGLDAYQTVKSWTTPTDPAVDTTPTSTDTTSTGTTPTTTTPPTQTTPSTPTDTGPTTVPWANGDPLDPPDYATPPTVELAAACADIGVPAELDDDEVDVKSHDDNLEVRTLTSPVAGWYELYDVEMSHQGTGEWNESAMVRILNDTSWLGAPVVANCDDQWVAVDPDNYGEPGDDLFYLGTFWFDAGDNVLELEHACPRIRAGSCPELEFLDDADTTCEANDGNSAHLDGEQLCLVAPAP